MFFPSLPFLCILSPSPLLITSRPFTRFAHSWSKASGPASLPHPFLALFPANPVFFTHKCSMNPHQGESIPHRHLIPHLVHDPEKSAIAHLLYGGIGPKKGPLGNDLPPDPLFSLRSHLSNLPACFSAGFRDKYSYILTHTERCSHTPTATDRR